MARSATFGRISPTVSPRCTRCVSGFSLIELLVVVVVISIMAALLLPALSKTKEQARGTACRSNMKQLALAFLMYAEDNEDTMPWPGGAGRGLLSTGDLNPQFSADWCVTPQEMNAVTMNSASADLPGFGHNAECGSIYPYVTSQPRRQYDPGFKELTTVYRCPSSGRLGEGLRVNYSANGWMDPGQPFGPPGTVVPSRGVTTASIVDASRKVLLINEDPVEMRTPAFAPASISRKVMLHLDRANVAFMDGHMESVLSKSFKDMRTKANIYFNAGR